MFAYCENNPVCYVDDFGYWPRLAIDNKTPNFCSLLFVLPIDDVISFYTFKSRVCTVLSLASCFIPEPAVSKAVGIVSGVLGALYADISSILSRYEGYDIYLRVSFNYKITSQRKYVYLVNTRFLKIGCWTEVKQVSISNLKCSLWVDLVTPGTGESVWV